MAADDEARRPDPAGAAARSMTQLAQQMRDMAERMLSGGLPGWPLPGAPAREPAPGRAAAPTGNGPGTAVGRARLGWCGFRRCPAPPCRACPRSPACRRWPGCRPRPRRCRRGSCRPSSTTSPPAGPRCRPCRLADGVRRAARHPGDLPAPAAAVAAHVVRPRGRGGRLLDPAPAPLLIPLPTPGPDPSEPGLRTGPGPGRCAGAGSPGPSRRAVRRAASRQATPTAHTGYWTSHASRNASVVNPPERVSTAPIAASTPSEAEKPPRLTTACATPRLDVGLLVRPMSIPTTDAGPPIPRTTISATSSHVGAGPGSMSTTVHSVAVTPTTTSTRRERRSGRQVVRAPAIGPNDDRADDEQRDQRAGRVPRTGPAPTPARARPTAA